MNRPDCLLCIHRDPKPPKPELTSCGHPLAIAVRNGPKARLLKVATGWGPIDGKVLGIRVTREAFHRMTWPFFFDAASLLNCDGYQEAK